MLSNLPPPGTEVRTLRRILRQDGRFLPANTGGVIRRSFVKKPHIEDPEDLFEVEVQANVRGLRMRIRVRRKDLEEMQQAIPL
jgi:hypothetical protein